MAQRFGGKYSPDGAGKEAAPPVNRFAGKRRTRVGGRVNMLFLAPLPLAIRAFTGDATQLAQNLVAFGVLMLAAWLTREGLIAQEAYEARKVARRPAFPRKMAASVLTGLGLGIAGFQGLDALVNPLVFAVAGTALHGFAFGLDPMRDKGMEGVDTFQQDRVARVVDEAEKHLDAMRDAIRRAGDHGLERRVERFQDTARAMFRTVEEDPRDLTAARKYLGVYLLGARDATVKFADLYSGTRDAEARSNYEALLDDLETNFAAKTRKLMLEDRTDMDIEIKVLRDRLQREGLHLD